MKAYLINSTTREIQQVDYRDYRDLRGFVGGSIEIAWRWNGDVLYVDEEALYKPQSGAFLLPGNQQPLLGNGVLVGRELYGPQGEDLGTADPALSIDQFRSLVRFLVREQVDAWGKANASEPAISITTVDHEGKPKTEVVTRYGELFRDIPKPEDT